MEALIKRTTKEDQKIAFNSIAKLSKTTKALSKKASPGIKIMIQESGEFVTIPKKALDLLMNILGNMAEGKSVSIIPSESEVSTQQAADVLNVSRPHVVKLLEEGTIPFKKVGSHRRILLKDLLAYDKSLREQRRKNLEFLTQQAQELALGYE